MRRTLQATRSSLLSHHTYRKRPLHVYTHGEGFLGCLGDGEFSRRELAAPVPALADKDIQCVSAGWTHSAAICSKGELHVWGRPFDLKQPLRINRIQRFLPFVVRGINAMASRKEFLSRPVSLPIGSPSQPKSPSWSHDARPGTAPRAPPLDETSTPDGLASRASSSSSTTSSNEGSNSPSTRSPSQEPASPAPAALGETTPRLKAVSVACSAALTVVLGEDHRVYCMGYNRWGQCGQGPDNVFTVFEPLRVGGRALEDERVKSLAVGFQQVLVLCESGRVYGWGKGLRGQLGVGAEMIELPMAVELPGKVVDLRSGFSHAVAVLENGDVYVWGRMQGTEVKKDRSVPVYHDQMYPRKVDIGGGRAVEAFCSSFNTLLRMEDGRIMMFGLEADTRRTVHTPVEVDIPSSPPGSFFGGFNDTILRTEGTSGPASAPALHRISFTSTGAKISPFVLPGLAEDRRVEAVSVGWQHTMALVA